MRQEGITSITEALEAAAFLKAVANHNRLLMLTLLVEREYTVGEMAETLSLSQPSVSQHLAKMRLEDIVAARKQGTQVYYSIQHPYVKELLSALQHRQQKLDHHFHAHVG